MQSVLHEAPQFVLRWQNLTEAANIDIGARLPGRGSDEARTAFWRAASASKCPVNSFICTAGCPCKFLFHVLVRPTAVIQSSYPSVFGIRPRENKSTLGSHHGFACSLGSAAGYFLLLFVVSHPSMSIDEAPQDGLAQYVSADMYSAD